MRVREFLSAVLVSVLFGIIAGLFFWEHQKFLYEQQQFKMLQTQISNLQAKNTALVRELVKVQAITALYDTDAKFIESVEGYEGLVAGELVH